LYRAVTQSFVVANPTPPVVYVPSYATSKCASLEGPSTADNTLVEIWTCQNVSHQKYAVLPVPSYSGRFYFTSQYSGRCLGAVPAWSIVVVQGCGPSSFTQQRFKVQGALNEDMYSIRDAQSSYGNCIYVPSSTNGVNLQDPTCDDYNSSYIWRFADGT
jgi:hypothetical protein